MESQGEADGDRDQQQQMPRIGQRDQQSCQAEGQKMLKIMLQSRFGTFCRCNQRQDKQCDRQQPSQNFGDIHNI